MMQTEPGSEFLDDYYGLYSLGTKKPIPLKTLNVDVLIIENIAKVKYSQKFENETNEMLEAEYLFTIPSTACYDGFTAYMNQTIIKGVIEEKTHSAEEYREFMLKGSTVAYAQLNRSVRNVLMVKIGNIPPDTEINIEFSYIEMLQVCLNKFWKFVLPNSLMPKPPPRVKYFTRKVTTKINPNDKCPFEIKVTIIGNNREITYLRCPSHEDSNIKINNYTATVEISEPNLISNKDFILIYSVNKITKPSIAITEFEEGYCAMISHFPELNVLSLDGAYKAYLEGRDPGQGLDMSLEIGEFVFLLDISQSMLGSRLKKAKEALLYFLKSLPEDSYFNVIGYADKIVPLDEESSIKVNEENINRAISYIEQMEGSSSVSKLFNPITFALKRPLKKGYPRNIFILMGSPVDDEMSKVVLKYLSIHRDKGRIFTLGIGKNAPTTFLKKAAQHGRGMFKWVADDKDIIDAVVYLLKTAIMPNIVDIGLDFDDTTKSLISYIIPNPKNIECMLPNQLMNFFIIFDKKLELKKKVTITLSYYNSTKGIKEEFPLEVDISKVSKHELSTELTKLGMYQFATTLPNSEEIYTTDGGDIENAAKQSLIQISKRYGILTENTAFICVIQEGNDVTRQVPTRKITLKHEKTNNDYTDYDTQRGFTRAETNDFEITNQQEIVKGPPIKILGLIGDGESHSPKRATTKSMAPSELNTTKMFGLIGNGEDLRNYGQISSPSNSALRSMASFKPKEKDLTEIIKLQKVQGYWQPNKELFNFLALNSNSIKGNIPKELDLQLVELVEKDWIIWTLIVLVWLKYHFSEREALWKCVSQKANTWLKKMKVEYSVYESRIFTLLRRQYEYEETEA